MGGIKAKDIHDFEKYAKKLADVVAHIREYAPEANAYLTMDELHLMSCDFHQHPISEQQEYIVTSIHMDAFDGGDW